MKTLFLSLLVIGLRLSSQVQVNPTSTIQCNKNSSLANFTISSGTAPFYFTVQTPTCAPSFTASSMSFTPTFSLGCAGVYTFIVNDSANLNLGTITHTVGLSSSYPLNVMNAGLDSVCLTNCTTLFLEDSLYPISFSLTAIHWSNGDTAKMTNVCPVNNSTYSVSALYINALSHTCTAVGYHSLVTYSCVSGIAEHPTNAIDFKIFPNPTRNNIFLESNAKNIEISELVIQNTLGQKLKEFIKPDTTIDISDLLPGAYFLTIRAGSYTKAFKFIKE